MPEVNRPALAVAQPTASDQGINPAIPALNGQEVTNYAGPLTADKGVLEKIAEAASGGEAPSIPFCDAQSLQNAAEICVAPTFWINITHVSY